jgi:hypothetical protein
MYDLPVAPPVGQCSANVLQIEMAFLIPRDREMTRIHAITVLHLAGALAKTGMKGVPQDR